MDTKLQLVKFHSDVIEVVEAEIVESDFVSIAANKSGVINEKGYFIVVKRVCKNLKLHYETQFKKLKSDPAYDTKLIKVKTAGGMQEVFCIPLNQLNGWLYTINPNKVKAVAKEKLLAYKKECQEVLYNHFIQKATQPPTNCPAADNMSTRIAGYKGQLALKKKQIEELRWRDLSLEEELKHYKQGGKYILLEHNTLDLAGSYARLREQLIGTAESLEYIAKNVKERIEVVDHFIKAIEKTLPKSKNVVKSATKHVKTQMQWQKVFIERKI